MVYLTARTASHLYKSPSSIDITATNGTKSLSYISCGGGVGNKYNSLSYYSPSVRFANNGTINSSRNHNNGFSWTLNTRNGYNNHHTNHDRYQYEYSQSKSTLDLTWLGKSKPTRDPSPPAQKPPPPPSSTPLSTLKRISNKSKSFHNLRQILSTNGSNHTTQQYQATNNGRPMATLSNTDRRNAGQIIMVWHRSKFCCLFNSIRSYRIIHRFIFFFSYIIPVCLVHRLFHTHSLPLFTLYILISILIVDCESVICEIVVVALQVVL